MKLWRVAIVVAMASFLGGAWGGLLDFLYPTTYWKLIPEVLGAAYIGLALVRRTKQWWLHY